MIARRKAGRGRWAALVVAGTAAVTLLAGGASPAGAACANETLRQEQSSTHLPDCRAYEQVSPPEKGFSNADSAILNAVKVTVGKDGSALAYCNSGPGGALVPAAEYCGSYLSRRTEEGWKTAPIAPTACGQGQQELALTDDLDYAILGQPESATCGVDPLDPSAPLPGRNLYRMSLLGPAPSFDLLTPRLGASGAALPFNNRSGGYEGISANADHLLFTSVGDQCSPAPCGLAPGVSRLFEWTASGVRLVARDGAGVPLPDASALAGGVSVGVGGSGGLRPMNARAQGYGGASADGNRIYFQNPISATNNSCGTPNCALYLREGATATVKVSQQECTGGTVACPEDTAPAVFKWANLSGAEAVFETTAKLVDDDPSTSASGNVDLYMFRQSDNPASDKNLVLLSKDSEPADGGNAGAQGVLGVSEDGDTVFFVASGQLVAAGPTAAGPKLYRWRWNGGSPAPEYLATLNSSEDSFIWLYAGGNNNRTLIERVSSGGERLLADTVAQLDPAADQDSTRDVYRWSVSGGWQCLSCQVSGIPSAGGSNIWGMSVPETSDKTLGAGLQDSVTHNSDPIRVASADGRRVFFTSMDRLTADDVNNTQDVYQWNDGTLGLISGGTGGVASRLIGTTPTGDDAFFVTADRLVGWDSDTLRDIYDARVGGGFPEPLPHTGGCEGEACRGGGSGAPTGTGPATVAFEGPGNVKAGLRPKPIRCPRGTRKVRVGGRTVCKKTQKHRKQSKRHSGRKGQSR